MQRPKASSPHELQALLLCGRARSRIKPASAPLREHTLIWEGIKRESRAARWLPRIPGFRLANRVLRDRT